MKKTLFVTSILGLLFVTNYIIAQTVPPRTPDPVSGCTGFETTASCRPEWAEALANCVSGSLGIAGPNTCEPTNPDLRKIFPAVSVCTQTNTTGPCRPERVNPYAAGTIARQAKNMGEQLGYTISCEASKASLGGGVDSTTNLGYFMNSLCTVNGQSGFSAEGLVTNPSNWEVLATELKSIEAAKVCGVYKVVFWNEDGSYKCVASPYYTDTCVGAENATKFNYVTGKSCAVSTTPTTTTPSPTYTTPSTTGWTTSMLDLLSKITINLKSQLDVIGKTGGTQTSMSVINLQTTTSYVSSVSKIINDMAANLKNQLHAIDTGQTQTGTVPQLPITDTSTYVTVSPGDPNAKCTGYETTENCHPEWAISAGNCVAGSINVQMSTCQVNPMIAPDLAKISPLVSICSATNMGGGCKPQRVNIYGANTMAREYEANSAGTQTCKIQQVTMAGNLDGNTNLPYYYNIVCSSSAGGAPNVNLWIEGLQKFATFSVGDTIKYHFTMENIDSVSSNYTATPGDKCVGGSNQGQQKPWVINSVSPFGVETAVAQQCQSGSSYVISLIGKNNTTGKTAASTISVYIK